MPLDKRCVQAAFDANIRREIAAGKPTAQAVAIGYSELKKACGVITKKRITAKEIIQLGKSRNKRRRRR